MTRSSFAFTLCTSLALFGGVYLVSQTAAAPRVAGKKAPQANDLAVAEAERGEWSRWRGPNGDGLSAETGLLTEWPAEGPELVWQAKGLGGGMASVAVADGHIYTLGNQGGNKLFAVNVADGSIAWTSEKFGGGNPNCTPTVDGDRVYGLSNDGELACVATADGKILWRKNFKNDFGGQMMSGWGYSESPLVDGERLICTPGSQDALLAALDKKTGKVIWKTPVTADLGRRGKDGAGYASIVISHAAGIKQYITLVGRGIVSVNANTGKLLWSYNGVANGTANIPTPIVSGDYVFCSSGYGTGSALLQVTRKGKAFEAEEKYFLGSNKLQNHHGGMILKDGYIYCGHGHNKGLPVCINLQTGEDAWRPGQGAGSDSAAIAYADGHFYFRYQDGTMALVEATPTEYKLKGQFKIKTHNGNSWPHPVIAGGKLYLRDQNDLLCYDVKKD